MNLNGIYLFTILFISLNCKYSLVLELNDKEKSCFYDNFYKETILSISVENLANLPANRDHAYFLQVVDKNNDLIKDFQENPKEKINIFHIENTILDSVGICFENFNSEPIKVAVTIKLSKDINFKNHIAKNHQIDNLYENVKLTYLALNSGLEYATQCLTRISQILKVDQEILSKLKNSTILMIVLLVLIFTGQTIYLQKEIVSKKLF